jgi:phage-related protein
MFEVLFYEDDSGEKPVETFLDSTEPKMRAKLISTMEILEEKGNMYFFYFEGKIIMTNGFVKKTQKTPVKEIELAKNYRNRFLEREGEY